ncbi:hypothetical protein IHQ71_07970 [Rhizobium sp. TH2]|uniref:hypothetical protein n=1 Tax=Rhizobium sp. TH2 TaxID=2775403 RepID=UPI002157403B|nr:hypothetical protein [Rhizobium sp. TH2]UVC10518.1 hypothetical protein IHQ71_07970 [Rhizobium sp. TH2]
MAMSERAEDASFKAIGGVHPDVARAEMEVLLSDPRFKVADRNRAFLKYIVEAAVTGRSQGIKAYSIAIDVFGRDANFDSNTDPIVRIEATRLRRSLELYYQSYGVDHGVHIRLPRGRYVAEFEASSVPEPTFKLVATYKDSRASPVISIDRPRARRFTLIEVVVIATFASLVGACGYASIQMLFR